MTDDEALAESRPILHVAGRITGLSIVVGAIVVGLYVLRLYYIYPRTDDAYVRANVVGVAPHVSGPIVELPIHDNQHLAKGALLFVVDPRPYQAALERAEANLALTNLQIDALKDAIHSAEARQNQLAADAAYDKQYLNRVVPLLTRHFVTANDVFNARSRLAAAQAAVENAQSEVRKAQNELGQYGDFNARRKAAAAAGFSFIMLFDNVLWPDPAERHLLRLLAASAEKTRKRLAAVGRAYLAPCAYLGLSSGRLSYPGKQAGVTFCLLFVGLSPSVREYEALWRLWGVILGVLVVAVVFIVLWPEYAGESMAPRLEKMLEMILLLMPRGGRGPARAVSSR